MREIIRLVSTLVVVTMVAAGLLGMVDTVTAPAIAERQEEDYRRALEEYYPGMADFRTESLGEDSFDLIRGAKGELIGIMASAAVQGYDDLISYNLALDSEGTILGLIIVQHSETQGVGDVIEKPEFQDQFLGKGRLDPFRVGEDVDTISGATKSTAPMIDSIRRVLAVVADNILDLEDEEPFDLAAIPDGAYRGSGEGLFGEIAVEVIVSRGKITAIKVVDHHERPTYLAEAVAAVSPQIIESQSLKVDTRTGATGSGAGIVSAVKDALIRAAGGEDAEGGEK